MRTTPANRFPKKAAIDGTGAVTEVEQDVPTVAVDNIAHFIDTLRALEKQIHQLEDMRNGVRREIQAALGDNQVGTVGGAQAVRWTRSVQHRLSVSAIRKKFKPEDLADCYVDVPQSRFTLIDAG